MRGVQDFAEVLVNGYSLNPERITLLPNAKATRPRILAAFRQLALALRANDSAVIFYAGHGWLDELGLGYWLPVEGDTGKPHSLVEHTAVKTIISTMRARHVLLISDSCFSGDLLRETESPSIMTEVAAAKAFSRVSRQVLTSGGLQTVPEGSAQRHSLFTEVLLTVLRENRCPVLPVSDVYSRIRDAVSSRSLQRPQLGDLSRSGGESGGSFMFIRPVPKSPGAQVVPNSASSSEIPPGTTISDSHLVSLSRIQSWRATRTIRFEWNDLYQPAIAFLPHGRLLALAGLSRALQLYIFETGAMPFAFTEDVEQLVVKERLLATNLLILRGLVKEDRPKGGAFGDLEKCAIPYCFGAEKESALSGIRKQLRYTAIAVSPDGRLAACSRPKDHSPEARLKQERCIDIWDLDLKRVVFTLGNPTSQFGFGGDDDRVIAQRISFNHDGRLLAYDSDAGIHLYAIDERRRIAVLRLPGARAPVHPFFGGVEFASLEFDPSGRYVIAATFSGACHIWELSSHAHLAKIDTGVRGWAGPALSASGFTLALRSSKIAVSLRRFPEGVEFGRFDLDAAGSVLLGYVGASDLLIVSTPVRRVNESLISSTTRVTNRISVWDCSSRRKLREVTLRNAGHVVAHVILPNAELRLVTAYFQERSRGDRWILQCWRIASDS